MLLGKLYFYVDFRLSTSSTPSSVFRRNPSFDQVRRFFCTISNVPPGLSGAYKKIGAFPPIEGGKGGAGM